jgi:cell wall-associated NlpC family hydrolase
MFRTRSARIRIVLAGGAIALGAVGIVPASASTSGGDVDDAALHVAQQQIGDPEQSGAAGPDAFDCSGLTSYSFKQAGETIPRTAQAQYDASAHKAQSAKEPGDLIFFADGGGIYHVGIYEGGTKMIAVSSSANGVARQDIYDSNYLVGSF